MEFLLLKYYFKTLFSWISGFASKKLFFFVFWFLLLLSFWIIVWLLCYMFFNNLINNFPGWHIFAPNIISFVVYIMFFVFIVSAFVACVATLYKSKEIDFLLTKPFKSEEIFKYGFLKIIFFLFIPALFLLVPIFFSYWIVISASVFYFILSLFLILFLVFLASFFANLIFLLLSAFVFALKKIYINIFFAISSIILSILWVVLYSSLSEVEDQESFLEQYIITFNYENIIYPWNWINSVFMNYINWEYIVFFSALVFFLFTILFFYKLISFFSSRYYYQSKENFQILNIFSSSSKVNLKSFLWENKLANLLKKDLLLYIKDPVWRTQSLVFIVLIAINILVLNSITLQEANTAFLASLLTLSNIALTWFLVSAIALKFVYPNISIEWKSFWILKTLPVKLVYIYIIKLLFFVVLFFIVAFLISYAYSSIVGFVDIIYYLVLLLLFPIVVFIVSFYFAFGNIYPKFEESNPWQIATSMPAFAAVIITNIYILISCFIFFYYLYWFYENLSENCEIYSFTHFFSFLLPFCFLSISLSALFSWFAYSYFKKL